MQLNWKSCEQNARGSVSTLEGSVLCHRPKLVVA